MEGQQLVDELKKMVEALKVFTDIAKTLTSTLEIREVLRVILEKIYELLAPTSWSLLLVDEEELSLRYEILINEPFVDGSAPVPIGQGVLGWVAQKGVPIVWPPIEGNEINCLPGNVLPMQGTVSMMCVPLRSKEMTFGVIEICRRGGEAQPFTAEDLQKFSVIGDYAAIAIENARNYQRVAELTIRDDLTTLFNVRYLHSVLDAEVLRGLRYRKTFSLIFLDLDHFKEVNDRHGHIHGSRLLQETAEVLRSHVRTVDFAFRYGGDEFVILLPETDKVKAVSVAERLRKAIEDNIFLQSLGLKAQFTASFGVAGFPEDAKTKEELIRMADEAMYTVKRANRNAVQAASPDLKK